MSILSAEDREHFLKHGFVTIKGAFPKEVAREWELNCWKRLGIDGDDPTTWNVDRVHMGGSIFVDVEQFAPRVYGAMQELLGGADRIQHPVRWSDHFIVNLAERADQEWLPPGPNTPGWHKDGDFFRHFLDSPEQGLLVFVNWTDVVHRGGPTYVATDSVPVVARFLAERPEGVRPEGFKFQELVSQCSNFIEATAEAGDVILLHPYTLHAGSQNTLRVKRIITNPPVALKEPLNFDRPDRDFSLVELAILRALGVDRFAFKPRHPREQIVPDRVRKQQELMALEATRAGASSSQQ